MNSSGKPVSCSNGDSFNQNGSSAPGLPVIEEEKFKSIVAARTGQILIITQYVAYIILHIKHFIPFYHLLPLEQDFTGATDKAFNIACSIIIRLFRTQVGE